MLVERISYELGLLVGDLIMFSMLPTSGFAAYKVAIKFRKFATAHSISRLGPDYITQNLFDCLPYID